MLDFIKHVIARRREDRGASAVEYGLLIAAIAAVVMVIAFALGSVIQDSFGDTCDKIATQPGGPTGACVRK